MYDVERLRKAILPLIPEIWIRVLEDRNLVDNFISNIIREIIADRRFVKQTGIWFWKKFYFKPYVIVWLLNTLRLKQFQSAFSWENSPEGWDVWDNANCSIIMLEDIDRTRRNYLNRKEENYENPKI